MSRYDRRTTTFSPDGRLFQVEYSLESINNAGFTCGIRTKEGVVFLGEKKSVTKLLDVMDSKKFAVVDDHIVTAAAGLVSDANFLIDLARRFSGSYREIYGEVAPPENLCQRLGDVMQYYTQSGGLRPYGVCLMFAGYTVEKGFQLLAVDPSGNYCEYRAHSVGANSSAAETMLKTESEKINDMTMEEGLALAAKIAVKCTDIGGSADKIDMATLTLESGSPSYKIKEESEVQKLLDVATAEHGAKEDS